VAPVGIHREADRVSGIIEETHLQRQNGARDLLETIVDICRRNLVRDLVSLRGHLGMF
jgi:hypothetical protein